MFKTFALAAMAAVLFSPVCMADDDSDNAVVVKTSVEQSAPPAQPVAVASERVIETSSACADEIDTQWARNNRLRMLGLTHECCGCPSDRHECCD